MPTACIIGAGLAGLAAAQHLRSAGWSVHLIDKGRSPGGRCATRWLGAREHRFDVGAQFWTARDADFVAAVEHWQAMGLCEVWCEGFPVLTAQGVQDGHDGFIRWRAVRGMASLAKALAGDCDLRQNRTVIGLHHAAGQWQVRHVAGDAIRNASTDEGEDDRVDAVICTQPVPQALDLVAAAQVPVADDLRAIAYDPCLYLLAERDDGEAILAAPGGLRIEDATLGATWLASQRRRGLRSSGEGLVLHADPAFSAAQWATASDEAQHLLTERLALVLARLGVTWTPQRVEIRRWKYSKCRTPQAQPYAVIAPGLALAGDGFGNRPRVEGAWCSGLAAARRLLDGIG